VTERKTALKLFVTIVVLCLLTGGLTVAHSYNYGSPARLTLKDGVSLDAWFLPHRARFSIPFVIWYSSEGPPFTLRVSLASGGHLEVHVVEVDFSTSIVFEPKSSLSVAPFFWVLMHL